VRGIEKKGTVKYWEQNENQTQNERRRKTRNKSSSPKANKQTPITQAVQDI
jgi:hypothetical protein